MKRELTYIRNLGHYAFRPDQTALILGVDWVTPLGNGSAILREPRACFHVVYPDGVEDWTPVANSDYELSGLENKNAPTTKAEAYDLRDDIPF